MSSISVALCTFNGERYLPQLLDSLEAQEHLPAELVVCDDHSSDRTPQLIESFAANAGFPVHLSVNERNLGPTKNFERAIERCSGELIALCDQDDVWFPKKLLRAAEAFEGDPEIGYSFSDAELMDEQAKPLDRRMWDAVGFWDNRRKAAARGDLLPLLIVYTFVQGTSMTFRADLRDFLLPIPHGWLHDAWIAMLTSFVRPYRMIEEPLLNYRLHSGQEIGVPASVMPDETGLQKWRARLRFAPLAMDFRKADLHRQRRRLQAMLYEEAASRVAERAASYIASSGGALQPNADEALQIIKDRASHLRLRGYLPDNRIRRVRTIANELRSGRYGRYSAGVLSALQDLIS